MADAKVGEFSLAHWDEWDWSFSPLGPPATWTSRLRGAMDILTASEAQIVLFWGPQFVALYNDAYAPTIGSKHPAALGRPAQESWSELWNDLKPLLRGVRESGKTFSAKNRPFYIERHGFGETAYFDISYSPVRDDDGSVGGVLCIVSETTEQVMANQRLREKEAALTVSEAMARRQADELASVYTAAPVGLAVLDRDLRFVRVNERLAEWNGRSIRDHIGKTIGEIVPDLDEQALGIFERVLAGEALWGQEVAGKTPGRPDGTSIWRENWVPLRDAEGNIVGITVSAEDVTEERRARRSLELLNRVGSALAGEHDLERLVQMVTDAGVELSEAAFGAFFYNVVGADGESYTLYSLSGAPREAFANFPMPRNTEVFAPTFAGTGNVRSDDILADPRYGQNAPRSGMPEGHLPVRSYLAVPVSTNDGKVLGGLFFGHPETGRFSGLHEEIVTSLASQAAVAIENAQLIRQVREANETLERRVAERTEELTKLHETLRQSQKMEAIGQLTGGVAHDFNNLLTVISGATEMLRKPDLSEEKRVKYLDGLTDTVKRAATLTGHLLAFSRRRVLQPEVLDLNIQLDALCEVLSRSISSNIEIVVEPSNLIARVEVDPTELETAILNAAVNARDAMPEGGTLTISIRDYSLGKDDAVAIEITDTGTGMTPETIERVFEPFYTTKPVGQGTGLGLSQIHGFAAQAGGAAEILSKVGVGTTVRLILPSVDKQPRASGHARGDATLPPGLRILLVEDNEQVLDFAERLLVDLGLEVVTAHNGADALRIAQEQDFDLVFSDVVMPGLSGIDLARQLHIRAPETPVLLATGYSEQMVGEGTAQFSVLAKPYGAETLTSAIHSLLVTPAVPS
ncbi:MAG: PAS domain-containing protein [Novosphingobium sp.]|nr:PAS domain-containing protein [Novosphingobium sp.]